MGGSADGAQEGDAVMKLIRVECYCDRKQGTCWYCTCEPNATTKKKKKSCKKTKKWRGHFFCVHLWRRLRRRAVRHAHGGDDMIRTTGPDVSKTDEIGVASGNPSVACTRRRETKWIRISNVGDRRQARDGRLWVGHGPRADRR